MTFPRLAFGLLRLELRARCLIVEAISPIQAAAKGAGKLDM